MVCVEVGGGGPLFSVVDSRGVSVEVKIAPGPEINGGGECVCARLRLSRVLHSPCRSLFRRVAWVRDSQRPRALQVTGGAVERVHRGDGLLVDPEPHLTLSVSQKSSQAGPRTDSPAHPAPGSLASSEPAGAGCWLQAVAFPGQLGTRAGP